MRRTLMLLLGLGACSSANNGDDGSDTDADTDSQPNALQEDWDRDLISTALSIDLSDSTGIASITIAASGSRSASLDVAGLSVAEVTDGSGQPVHYRVVDGRLDVATAADTDASVTVGYGFTRGGQEGFRADGTTLTWPYYCGQLFPCHSEPSDGLTFTLDVIGAADGETIIFPTSIPQDAPSYQLAWATGVYTEHVLGTTAGGTEVVLWTLPGSTLDIGDASILLTQFEWLEATLGPYAFGDRAGGVEADWGGGAYGGMEHHPFWHTGSGSMSDTLTQAHEAAHGWYGDGVRIECWEDFVLSEGTVSYLAAKAQGAALGADAEAAVWATYHNTLVRAVASGDHVAWPRTCGEVDVLKDGLFSSIPYKKGAFFFKAVEDEVGAGVLLAALASFYTANVGDAARMEDLLAHLTAVTGFDVGPLAAAWLEGLGIPDS